MKELLFIDKNPFGILVDTYKYCEYLKEEYDITYVCIDYGYKKLSMEGVKVVYVPNINTKLFRGVVFTCLALLYALKSKGFIFVTYYKGCEILKKLLFWKRMHVDVRTLSVSPDVEKRAEWNSRLNKTIIQFNTISFITEGIKKQLSVPREKEAFVIPLGADAISLKDKTFDSFKLLYVGTLYNRRIIDTVIGLRKFVDNHKDIDVHYTIIGDGEEFDSLCNYVNSNQLFDIIELKGKIPYSELTPFFDESNIGVSYVPVTEYYEYQPPTKTFEYIMSGMFCLATNTYENKRIVNERNGLLHVDSPEGFCEALESLLGIRDKISSQDVRKTLHGYSWREIVENKVKPMIESCI